MGGGWGGQGRALGDYISLVWRPPARELYSEEIKKKEGLLGKRRAHKSPAVAGHRRKWNQGRSFKKKVGRSAACICIESCLIFFFFKFCLLLTESFGQLYHFDACTAMVGVRKLKKTKRRLWGHKQIIWLCFWINSTLNEVQTFSIAFLLPVVSVW